MKFYRLPSFAKLPGYCMNNQLLEPESPFSVSPGCLVQFDDFNEIRPASASKKEIFAVQWNIERAYKLDAIIELLQQQFLDADVIALQELDIYCERSGWRDSALEIARALKMRCIFVPEFEELHSPLRSARNQGGGGHGNAIFTWWDVEAAEVIAHSAEFNWNSDGDRLGEPRRGGRFSVAAFLKNPHDPTQRLLTYSVHLEVFCGIFGRLRQFSQILRHSKAHLSAHPYQMILGDLNTMAHGLARFFSRYCCDAMRWRSLGWSEAEWWQKNLMQVTPEWTGADGINALLAAHHHLEGRKLSKNRNRRGEEFVQELIEEEIEEHEELESNETSEDEDESNETKEDEDGSNESSTSIDTRESNTVPTSTNATSSSKSNATSSTTQSSSTTKSPSTRIFSVKQLKDLVNPHFYCPFSPRFDMTLRVRGFAEKLDWMLVRGLRCLGKGMENDRFDRSDHKLLWLRAEFLEGDGDVGVRAYEEFRGSGEEGRGRMASVLGPVLPVSRALLWGAAVGFLSTVMFLLMNNNKSRN